MLRLACPLRHSLAGFRAVVESSHPHTMAAGDAGMAVCVVHAAGLTQSLNLFYNGLMSQMQDLHFFLIDVEENINTHLWTVPALKLVHAPKHIIKDHHSALFDGHPCTDGIGERMAR